MLRLKPTPLARKFRGHCGDGNGSGHSGLDFRGRHGSMKKQLAWTCDDHERRHLRRHPYPSCRVLFFSSQSPQNATTTNNDSMAFSRALHERRVAEAQAAIVQKQVELLRQGVSSRELYEPHVAEAQAASVQKQEDLLLALHERRVAEAQAAIFQQQQELEQKQQLLRQTQQLQHQPKELHEPHVVEAQAVSVQKQLDLRRALHERRVAEAQAGISQQKEELQLKQQLQLQTQQLQHQPEELHEPHSAEAQAASVQKQEDLRRARHERRVAEAQVVMSQKEELRQKQQLQLQTQQLQHQQEEQQLALQEAADRKQTKAERRHILVNSIRHWLAKDPTFFESTMTKLSINSNWLTINSTIHNTTSTDLERNDTKEKKSIKQTPTVATAGTPPIHPNDPNHPNQNHAVWNQYRHLFYDSIGSFRNELERNPPVSLQEILEELEASKFANARFSKLYRQERGHQFQQLNLEQRLLNQQEDWQQQKEALQDMQRKLEELQDKLHRQEQRYLQRQKRKQQEELEQQLQPQPPKERLGTGKEQSHPTTTSTIMEEDSPSILSRAWQAVSSLLGGGASPVNSSNSTNRQEVNERKGWFHSPRIYYPPNDNTNNTPQPLNPLPTGSPPRPHVATTSTTATPTMLHREVQRQQNSVKDQERSIDMARQQVQRLEQLQQEEKKKKPILSDEYQQARELVASVRDSICHELALHIQERHKQLIAQYQTLDAKTDLTKPHEWYSYARLDHRKIIFHGGPTNSGKTYTALQRLKQAEKGLYLAPLRLLAAEVYDTLTAEGIFTSLYTGQERRDVAFSTHAAATVEMANVADEYDVVVMDEIQMIADATRGAAWTRALLGLRCKEIHVCGGNEAKEIVQKIAQSCGDSFEVHSYERFTPLQVLDNSLARKPKERGCYQRVEPGDCVVAFSRKDIFAIKREIETTTNHKCCVIYGKLPPQTRTDQARRFNDPNSGYDVLVASDAIGMGLNLNIRRIIFNSVFKFNGDSVVRLDHSSIKQIAGRAGRRNSQYPNGQVTCRDPRDLEYIRESMKNEIDNIEKAGLLPTASHIQLFSEALQTYNLDSNDDDDDEVDTSKSAKNNKFNGTAQLQPQPRYSDLYRVLRQFSAMATVKGYFFLCRQTEMKLVARRLKGIPLPIRDAYTMCLSPTSDTSLQLLENFARKLSRGEVPGMPSDRVPKRAKNFDDLGYLCGVYGDADLFMWLQFKFPPTNAVEHQAALVRKEQSIAFINEALANSEALKLTHCYVQQAERHRSIWQAGAGTIDSVDGPMFDDAYDDDDKDYDESDDDDEAVY